MSDSDPQRKLHRMQTSGSTTLTVRISTEDKERLERVAEYLRRSLSSVAYEAIEVFLDAAEAQSVIGGRGSN